MNGIFNLKTVGFLLIGYGGLFFVAGQIGLAKELNAAWYTQIIMCVGAGVGCIMASQNSNFSKIVELLLQSQNTTVPQPVDKPVDKAVDKKTNKTVVINKNEALTKQELDDLQSLDYLTDRFSQAEDSEGVDLCEKMQLRLFNLHHRQVKVKEVENEKV